jgi:hypothetical protein
MNPYRYVEDLIEQVLYEADRRGIAKDVATEAAISAVMLWRCEDRRAVATAVQRYLIEVAEHEHEDEFGATWEVLLRYDPAQVHASAERRCETVQRLGELVKRAGQSREGDLGHGQ